MTTHAAADLSPAHNEASPPSICHRRYRVGQHVLSGVETTTVGDPRGVVLALHGSGYTGQYWDGNGDARLSLLRLGRLLGFHVVAVDRPGYALSSHLADTPAATLDGQADIIGNLVFALSEEHRLPVFLVGHSFGSLLAVQVAVGEGQSEIAGLDLAGLPVNWREDLRDTVSADTEQFRAELHSVEARAMLFFGPVSTYNSAMLSPAFAHRIPRSEMIDTLTSPELLRTLAPKVRVPVQCTVAEFEQSLTAGREAVDADIALFSASPRTVSRWQPYAGHNVSLHHVGRAYHLRALAFFDEIIATNGPAVESVPIP